jgi:hypothetical protein
MKVMTSVGQVEVLSPGLGLDPGLSEERLTTRPSPTS